jgi:type IV pilus assembly protein PilM
VASHSIIGLDVGSKFIKALQLSETNGQFKVTEYGVLEIPPQYSIPDAISELVNSKRWKTKRVVSSVSGRFVFVRYINMPLMSNEELVNAAKYELGKYIPVEVDEVLHDSQKLEELPPQEGGEAEMRVLLVAAKKTFIEEHIQVLRSANLVPQIIDVDSFALGNAYELSGLINAQAIRPGKLVALADIGAAKTNINIMSDTLSFFTREFYKGGDDITDAVSKKLGVEPKEAEMLKRNPGGDLPRVEECIAGVLDDICHDINISIDYFENQYDKKVEEIFITGGSSACIGMQETLEKTVQKPVTKWNPMQYVEADLPADSMQQLTDSGAQCAIALGLASRIRKD